MNTTIDFMKRPRRNQRRDDLSTRGIILEAAGQVFAERGFAEATSKEICERAEANSAAVNYYFGGKESLYEEVLVEAHRQMVSLEDLDEILLSDIAPEDKLRAFFSRMIKTAASSSELWGIKVYMREMVSPSPFVTRAMSTTVLPKADKLKALIQEITGLPSDSPHLQRATGFVVIPCISMIMIAESLRLTVLPETAGVSEGMLEDMLAYTLGGLKALSEAVGT